jgi:hypothetical protein
MGKEKETLENAFTSIISEFLKGKLNVAMPAIVTAYNDKNKVSVQPVVHRKYKGKDPKPLPTIEDVPVMFPGSGGYWLTFPITVGSWVMLVCSQRSIDAWKNSDGEVGDATTPRLFSMSDAVALPGLLPFSSAMDVTDGLQLRTKSGDVKIKINDTVITITNGLGTIAMDDTGKVDVNGHLTVEPS